MCFDYDGTCDVSARQIVVARKEHRCVECRRTIFPREFYERVETLYDGRWTRYKTCFDCMKLRALAVAHEEAEGCRGTEAVPPFGELIEYAEAVGLRQPEIVFSHNA